MLPSVVFARRAAIFDDLRHAARALRKNPGTTAIAILALGLGLGANVTMFSYVNVLILRPFPFPDFDRIVTLRDVPAKTRSQREPVSPANFLDWRDQSRSFRQIAAYDWWEVNLTGVDAPERLQGYRVSPEFFPLLGMRPRVGRTFSNAETQPGNDGVVVISDSLWKRRFGAAPGVVGRRVSLDGRAFTIAGIMPESFDFPLATDIWAPLAFSSGDAADRATRRLSVLGRLAAGVPLAQARAEMDSIARRLEAQYPDTNRGRGIDVATLREQINPTTDRFVMVLMAAAAFVLLLACANVANLQLARSVTRTREIAIRSALGAGRWRIARQMLAEGLLVSAAGAIVAVLVASWELDLARASISEQVYRWVAGLRYLKVDARVLAFTAAAALCTGVLCGIASAIHASSRGNLNERLREGARGSAATERHSLRKILVAGEVALAMILLVGAGLMVKTFRHIAAADLGYNPANLLSMRIALPELRYQSPDQARSFYEDLRRRISSLSGAKSAAVSGSGRSVSEFTIAGRPPSQQSQSLPTGMTVSPEYFSTMTVPVLKGRPVEERDGPLAPGVVLVSESVARQYWPTAAADPIGSRVRIGGPDSPWLTVVGVTGDIRDWFGGRPIPLIYTAFAQDPRRSARVFIKTHGDPLQQANAARAEVLALDRNQPIYDLRTEEQLLADQYSGVRISAVMMAGFGVFALLLAASGAYAVISYSVAQRTHEIGIRIALGASRAEVVGLVVRQAVRLAAAGLAVGLPAAYLLSRVMSSAVYGVVALDWRIFAAFAGLILASAMLASYMPARRAASVDPITALRAD